MNNFKELILAIVFGGLLCIVLAGLIITSNEKLERHIQAQDEWLIELSKENLELKEELRLINERLDSFYNVPISFELQEYIQELAITYDLEVPLILGIIEQESGYNAEARYLRAQGLMQVDPYWKKFDGIDNLYDPRQNILAGVLVLDYIRSQGITNTHEMLMAYNGNLGYMESMVNAGYSSTPYTRGVIDRVKRIEVRNE